MDYNKKNVRILTHIPYTYYNSKQINAMNEQWIISK